MKRDRRKIMLRYKLIRRLQPGRGPAKIAALTPGSPLLRVFPPALCAQRTGRTFTAAVTPGMPRAAFSEIAGVGVLADQIDQPCPTKLVRQLPGTGLVQPHQRRVQFKRLVHPEMECDL